MKINGKESPWNWREDGIEINREAKDALTHKNLVEIALLAYGNGARGIFIDGKNKPCLLSSNQIGFLNTKTGGKNVQSNFIRPGRNPDAIRRGNHKIRTVCIRKLGKPEPDLKKLEVFVGPPLLQQFMKYAGLDEETAVKAVEYYRERYTDVGIFENRPYPGVEEMLEGLKA